MAKLLSVTELMIVSVILALCSGLMAKAENDSLTIYIDADFTIRPAPAEAIEIGLRTAFAGTWAENGVRIVSRDHRKNARRSLDTFREAKRDPSSIVVIGGMDSPPYFANHAQINTAGLPLLLPWSAGGLLTRFAKGPDNWIFRLSVDDTKAASKLTRFARKAGCTVSSLAVVNNPWGKGNAKRIVEHVAAKGGVVTSVNKLPVNSGMQQISDAVREINLAKPDCVFVVAGLQLGAGIINALSSLENPPRVISHWGILGNRVTDYISPEAISRVRLGVLGTCGLRLRQERQSIHSASRETAMRISSDRFDPDLHPAPHGYFHAHDIGLLLLQAIEIARTKQEWTQGPDARRRALRDALYHLDTPVDGLLKTYLAPFEPVGEDNIDGHEALGASDLCMTTINDTGHIVNLSGG